jgi:capsular polysaccharide transport system permease protein
MAARTSVRAAVTSSALRAMARRAARIGARRSWVRAVPGRWSLFAKAIVGSFAVIVLVPALVAGIYFGLVASRQYVSEMRFAVRGASNANDFLGGLGNFANSQRTEDALVIADYIRSRRMFEDLDKEFDLKRRFSMPAADFVARMDDAEPIEDLVKYWRTKVDVKVDKNSVVTTVTVRAFAPEDALAIAKGIGDRSERLANELSERAREDALRRATDELAGAELGMQATIERMRQTRNEQGLLDATKTAEVVTKVIGDLHGKLLLLESEYEVGKPWLSPSAPQMRLLATQIENLRQQIATLERRIGGTTGQATLVDAQGQLERRAIEHKVAEQQYALAVGEFERARLEQTTKQVYLVMFVPPRLAEDALYPKRLLLWSIFFAVTLAIWGAGVGAALLIRDHLAI